MNICYHEFDNLHSMIGLGKIRVPGKIVLAGRSNAPEMKILLLTSKSGEPITLREVFDELSEKACLSDGSLLSDEWINIDMAKGIRAYFYSLQSARIEINGDLCRYTAFSYVLRNKQIEIYDCDNRSVNHKAYVDVTMPVSYSVEKHLVEKKRLFHRPEMVESGFYKVTVKCENVEQYDTGYVHYKCEDKLFPLTKEVMRRGTFYVKECRTAPELITKHREIIELRRL